MKIISISRTSIFLLFFSLFTISLPLPAGAQRKERIKAKIDSLLNAREYTFYARMMQPLTGPQQPLTANYYSVSVTKDSIISYLPYAGRAYVAPTDPTEGGIKFTSRKFIYTSKVRKNGMYEITIAPADIKDIQRLYLFIGPDGFTTLQVVRVTAQQVSFTGEIVEK